MVLRPGLALALTGVAVGIWRSLVFMRASQALLFGVSVLISQSSAALLWF